MNEHDSFLQVIMAAPDDDTPRLVYADWLEEHGDPRGEFIQVQCQLANMPEYEQLRAEVNESFPFRRRSTAGQGAPLAAKLCLREAELLAEYRRAWTPPVLVEILVADYLPPPVAARGLKAAVFRRGFVEEVGMRATHFLEHAAAIRAATPLRDLRLLPFSGPMNIAWQEFGRLCRGLRSLHLEWEGDPVVLQRLLDETPTTHLSCSGPDGVRITLTPTPNRRPASRRRR